MKTHSDETLCECSTCGKAFKQKASLTSHLRVHTGEAPHECSTCGRGFKRKFDLKTHLLVHTGERPFICSVCDKSYKSRRNLVNHMKTHAKGNPHLSSMSESCGINPAYQKDTLPSYDSSLSTNVDDRCENEGLPTLTSTLNEAEFPCLHSSETPYIITVKQEEDI